MFRRNSPLSMQPEGSPSPMQQAQGNTVPSTPTMSSSSEPPLLRPAMPPMAAQNPFAPQVPISTSPLMPAPRSLAPQPVKAPEAPVGNRFGGIPGVLPRRVAGSESASDMSGMRKLIVGKQITLSGDITACDILIVEGNIEATLREAKHIEITEDGHFKGSAEVEEADISGKFEGSLTVRGRLRLRGAGQIEGTLSYGELEVEVGGKITGEVKTLGTTSRRRAAESNEYTREPALAE
jgi:cytoskeletal protein CcmA (bactofilin family)